jgi:hypothetical protein
MIQTLRYRSSRTEVWRWYWRTWKSKLWWQHLALAAAMSWLVAALSRDRLTLAGFLLGFSLTAALVVLIMASWPQVMFKSKERVLEVGPDGWSTRIGAKSGSRSWAQVASIEKAQDTIAIISTTGNALIIPARAFSDAGHMAAFLEDAQRWHRSFVD